MSLLAIDIGSSSCKAVTFSEDGRALAQKTCSYPPLQTPHPCWVEMPVEAFWQAFTEATQAVAAASPKDPVEALAVSSHGESFVPVNAYGEAIAPAILNMDNRATAEAARIRETLGAERLFAITGLTAHPMYPLAKMLWLRAHEAKLFGSAARWLAIPTYILTRLGLPPLIDYSLASRFLAFDIGQRAWSSEILENFDVDAGKLPVAVPAGTMAGELSPQQSAKLGLRAGTRVVVGGHDQPCGALGSGVLESGRVAASLGTYECLVAASRVPAASDRALATNLNSYCHVVPERYVTLAYFPAGIMLEWFLRVLCSRPEEAHEKASEIYRHLESEASIVPSGLCIAPHLFGTGNPDFNPEASGVIAGIRPGTTRADLYQAILEGIACEFASVCELLEQATGTFTDIYVSGGGALSQLGLKLRAALGGRELHVMDSPDTVCLGTAMLAGVAVGKYGSLAEAAQRLTRLSKTVAPDTALAAHYQAQREQYQILYSSLAPFRRAQAASSD